MSEMFRLDFSRGTVEKIDASVPPRGWQEPAPGPDRDVASEHPGYSFGDPGTAPRASQDEE